MPSGLNNVPQNFRPLSCWKLISKLISKFMLISSFGKKISVVNSQLSKEINFKIIFRNLEHVLFCEILQQKFRLWSAVIGQSAVLINIDMKHRWCCLHLAFESLFPVWKVFCSCTICTDMHITRPSAIAELLVTDIMKFCSFSKCSSYGQQCRGMKW